MITDFEDFCTWVFVVVDDIWKPIAPFFKRPGPKPECGDSELIAMALIGECRGWHMETELLSCWKEYRHLFPRHSVSKPVQSATAKSDAGDQSDPAGYPAQPGLEPG